MTDLKQEVRLFRIFDILGDTVRTGPQLWYVDRARLEDVKNHVLDLILILRLLERYLPVKIAYDKAIDYIICHDLPEAITGDITKFEGVSSDEIDRVTNEAIAFLDEKFANIIPIYDILNAYENRVDLESKIVNMIDKIHSATTFVKYQSEKNIDMDDPRIMPELRNHPFVVQKISEGKDLADIFLEFHLSSVMISDAECEKYGISREDADKIVDIIKPFALEMDKQRKEKTLSDIYGEFPESAMKYNSMKNN